MENAEVSKTTVLAELPEASAAGATAAIYAELRRNTGVPVVALIFRHLATHPGLLEEIWDGLQPLMKSGLVQETGWSIAAESVPPGLVPPIKRDVLTALGLGGDVLDPLVNAIEAYNRVNPINLLTVLLLLKRLEAEPRSAAPIPSSMWTPPEPTKTPLSVMARPDEMPPHIRRLINDFGFGDRGALDPVVPSLLRHLATAPGLLGTLHVVLMPRFADGSLEKSTRALQSKMRDAAGELAIYLPPLPLLASNSAAVATMKTFTDSWIPLMTITGMALRRSMEV